jgi:hypothetical protein
VREEDEKGMATKVVPTNGKARHKLNFFFPFAEEAAALPFLVSS